MNFAFQAPHNVTRFSMSANSGENFMIDAVTGKVALKKSLLGADNERYEVRDIPGVYHKSAVVLCH